MEKTMFICSHVAQIKWYAVFAEAFKELGANHKVILFVQGKSAVAFSKPLKCYDEIIDLTQGFNPKENFSVYDLKINDCILNLEKETNTSFMWEDLKMDRFVEAKNDPAFIVQYYNYGTQILTDAFNKYQPIVGLGEYTLAFYRYAKRLFNSKGKEYLYPIPTRYFERFCLEDTFNWEWKSAVEHYHKYVQQGIPQEVHEVVYPIYDRIAKKFEKPSYSVLQTQTPAGYTDVSQLSIKEISKKFFRAFKRFDKEEQRTNILLSAQEKGLSAKVRRMIRERKRHADYNKLTVPKLPENIKYCVFLLHYQPEYSTDGLGKYYNDQVSLIRNAANSIPAGHFLVVKEHSVMVGLRDVEFYLEITKLKNVILLAHGINSIQLVKNCELIITIVGTIALEGMFIGKPSIMFAKYAFNSTNLIHYCPSYWELPGMIRDILKKEKPSEQEIEKHALALLAGKYSGSHKGQLPLMENLIDSFADHKENYSNVKQSFTAELKARKIIG
ncbi:MAG: hypothetical protein NT150_15195 [Bacteroidetes bacterium]|nr:hypothetical protein [Bacteroidota bacterium]